MTRTATSIPLLRWAAALAALVLAATLAVPGAVGPAVASHQPVCGETIRHDVTLTADLDNCEGDGLVIEDDGITLDVNGFTISGLSAAGEPTPQETGTGAGVLVDGADNVTITSSTDGATIEYFDGGVELDNSDAGSGGHTVENLHLRHNQNGPTSLWGEGIGLWESDGNTLQNNVVEDNGRWGGIGLYGDLQADGSDNNTITSNTVTQNQRSIWTVNENIGIRIEPYSNDNLVKGNTVTENALDGVAVFAHSDRNTVEANDVRDNGFHAHVSHRFGDGIRIHGAATADDADPQATDNTVEQNTVCGNYGNGIGVAGMDNDIFDNTSGDPAAGCDLNAQSDPLNQLYHDLHDYNEGCDNNSWLGNRTAGSGEPDCTLQ